MKLIATINTIPSRKDTFRKVLHNLLHEQTQKPDAIHVWLYKYEETPKDIEYNERVVFHLIPSNPGPWIRYNLDQYLSGDEVVATLDDDLIYPADYLEKGIRDLTRLGKKSSLSYGGLYWDNVVPVGSIDYFGHRRLIPMNEKSDETEISVILGNCGFHWADNIRNIINLNLPCINTNDDLMVSYQLRNRGIAIYSPAKESGWIKEYPASCADNALWRRDRINRMTAFKLLVQKHAFNPYIADEKDQNDIKLIIAIGPISDEEMKNIYGADLNIKKLHTLEIIEGSLGAYTSRRIRRHKEHFVSVKDTIGRFSDRKSIDILRKTRNCVVCSPDIVRYLFWIGKKYHISEMEIIYYSGQQWIYDLLNICRKYFLENIRNRSEKH